MVQLSNGSVGLEAHVLVHHAGEDGIVGLTVGDVIDSAQRVGQGVDGGTAGVSKGDAGEVAGQQEVAQQGQTGVGAVLLDGLVAF